MSIRKRVWTTAKGKQREAFIVDYSFVKDGERHRAIKTFATEKAARAFRGKVEQPHHKHIPGSASITVNEAAERWLLAVKHGSRQNAPDLVEDATLRQYTYHVKKYIEPQLGSEKVTTLTKETVSAFRDRLLRKLSRGMARKIVETLKAILAEADYHGDALKVIVGKDSKRHKQPVEIPSPSQVRAIFSVLDDEHRPSWSRWRVLVTTAIHTGMRPSELRGLPWKAVDLKHGCIKVTQRADETGNIGSPKSAAARRTIDIPPSLVALLKEWKLESKWDLVFANGRGNPESLANIHNRCWVPLRKAAGIDSKHKLYALRHYHASALIDDGANPKEVQVEMGHASITVTFDVYGHLFHDEDASQRRKDRAARLDAVTRHETRHRGEKVSKINERQ
jgi:integrase